MSDKVIEIVISGTPKSGKTNLGFFIAEVLRHALERPDIKFTDDDLSEGQVPAAWHALESPDQLAERIREIAAVPEITIRTERIPLPRQPLVDHLQAGHVTLISGDVGTLEVG
jgi:hypothetical protein